MKSKVALFIGLVFAAWMFNAAAEDAKAYTEGSVTQISYIKVKPGKFDDYMKYLDTTYKAVMEASKKAGLILGYRVFSAQARSPREPDLILTVTYANMAALDKTDEGDAVAAKVVGSMDVRNKGAIDREALRELLGGELVRELILK